MVGGDLITIVLVLAVGYWLFSTGKLDEIFGSFTQMASGQQQQGDVTQENTGGSGENVQEQTTDIENGKASVSGENAGASVNGKCVGDPEQCRKAEELLEMIQR